MKVLLTLQDVEPAVRINALLEQEGASTTLVSPLDDMRGEIRRARPDIMVFTGDLGDPATVAIVKEQLWDGAACVGLSENVDPDHIERLRGIGYVEVFAKPVNPDEVVGGLHRIVERRELQQLTGLIGESDAMRAVLVQVQQMAPVSATVLIEGESGTGKELAARAIKTLSQRKTKPFIAVNVGALPESLVESELFGHEKGAFTGAAERRLGRFELADGGTLFLDEIGEIPPATQVKLLRVLENQELYRVGGVQPIQVDVRVVAATNAPLRELVEEGQFRADLFYRLNVLRIYLPPLRERKGDIPRLVRRFIQEYSARHERPFRGISAEAMQMLVDYPWPGNVRELRNLIESMVVLAPGHEIEPRDLPRQIREGANARLLPVHIGPVLRDQERAVGRELEFIVRSLIELKLQVEELRRRVGEGAGVAGEHVPPLGARRDGWIGDVHPGDGLTGVAPVGGVGGVLPPAGGALPEIPAAAGRPPRPLGARAGGSAAVEGIEPKEEGRPLPPQVVKITPGTKMADIERAAIEAALRETQGNRRRAARLLGIGERTLYRKIEEYRLTEHVAR